MNEAKQEERISWLENEGFILAARNVTFEYMISAFLRFSEDLPRMKKNVYLT